LAIWSVKGTPPITFGQPGRDGGGNGLAFSPDGKTLASRGNDHIIRLWDFRTGKEVGRLPPPNEAEGQIIYYGRIGNTLTFSPDGKMLAAFNTWNTPDARGIVFLYEVETGKELRRIEGLERSLSGRLAFGPGVLAICWGDRNTKLYDAGTGKELRPLGEPKEGDIIHAAAFSPDGKTVALRSGTESPSIRVYDVTTGKKLADHGEQPAVEMDNIFLRLSGSGCTSMTLDFAPNGKSIAEATGGRVVRVWKLK
jgi:WD40 repeat protein